MAIRYTKKEELWNVWSHAGGILLGVAMAVVFLVWVNACAAGTMPPSTGT